MKRLLCLLFLSPALILGQSGDSERADNVVLKAMTDELERSVTELQFRDLEKPYFIQYSILDEEVYIAQATFGALTASNFMRQRVLQTQVRVGDYDFDSSEFIPAQGLGGATATGVTSTMVIDNDYNAIRHALWLSTDAAYKQSVEQLARKRAFVQNKIQDEQVPDFSQEQPLTAISSTATLKVDEDRLKSDLRAWSAIFKEFPAIQQSSVLLQIRLMHRYLVNNEGTRTLQPSYLVSLEAVAGMQSRDGLPLTHSVPFYSRSVDLLPSREKFAEAIRTMAADLMSIVQLILTNTNVDVQQSCAIR